MQTSPIIKKITYFRDAGIFRDFTNKNTPDFQQFNLVYGFNGTGKTTLSRLFSSLEAGVLRPQLSNCNFKIELSELGHIKNDYQLNLLKGRLFVFNCDFVETNLQWKDARATPIFYLGAKQNQLAKRLLSIQTSISELNIALANLAARKADAEKVFSQFKRDLARTIEQRLAVSRKYDSSKLSNDYADQSYKSAKPLDEEEANELSRQITLPQPPPHLKELKTSLNGLNRDAEAAQKIIDTTIGDLITKELHQHSTMLNWLKDGLDYHLTNNLTTCLFCNNSVTEKRKLQLTQIFNQQFIDFQKTVSDTISKLDYTQSQLRDIELPATSLFLSSLQSEYEREYTSYQSCAAEIQRLIKKLISALEIKSKDPASKTSTFTKVIRGLSRTIDYEATHKECVARINAIIRRHNDACSSFGEMQDTSRKILKSHLLLEHEQRYWELEKAVTDITIQNSEALTRLQNQRDNETEIQKEMKEHAPGAEKINNLLQLYLGHGELSIEAVEDGYQIRRNKQQLLQEPSEGEKTAIAICYFISMLGGEGRKLEDLIVVIDDPISSLDTRALNFSFNLIKTSLSGARQLFLLTHNIHFMNEAKKWLKHKERRSCLLFLQTTLPKPNNPRETSLINLPDLIRNHDSECYFLFDMALRYSLSEDAYTDTSYLMPNILRKVMDVFLAFKVPGNKSLSQKLSHPCIQSCGISKETLAALDRLVQLESHADSLDDLLSLSPLTIEEVKVAACTLMRMIELVDKDHFSQLKDLCIGDHGK